MLETVKLAAAVGVGALVLSQNSNASLAQGVDNARHLLSRACFGGSLKQLQELSQIGASDAVINLVDEAKNRSWAALPGWASQPTMPITEQIKLDIYARRERRQTALRRRQELRHWQMRQLLFDQAGLQERTLLIWMDLFTVQLEGCSDPVLFTRYMNTLRINAFGNYRHLLRDLLQDVAFLNAQNAMQNLRTRPNTQFAEVFLNTYTLGPNVASRQDIRDFARSMTGIAQDPDDALYLFTPSHHDRGEKTIFGQTRNFTPDDLADLVLAQPQAAERIVAHFWQSLVSPNLRPDTIKALANNFRKDYEIAPLIKNILLHKDFWDYRNRGTLVKDPLELLISSNKLFKQSFLAPSDYIDIALNLGYRVFDPPSIHGYPRQEAWITPVTLPLRQRIVRRMTRGLEVQADQQGEEVYRWAKQADILEQAVLPLPPRSQPAANSDPIQRLSHYLGDPAFQLK